ncbi:MAG: aminoglycoside phosphotransferase family protein [Myxococcaceae bacterium]
MTREVLDRCFPAHAPFERPCPLAGGNLNEVWRVTARDASFIVKRAPPWVASAPAVPLSRRRLLFEAKALRRVASLGQRGAARAPRLVGFHRAAWLLLEEDLGPGPDLSGSLGDAHVFGALGDFIGALHATTLQDAGAASRFRNLDVQRARLESQYRAVGGFAARSGAPDFEALGRRAVDLGLRLLLPGRCLVMGDLWLRSVLVRQGQVGVIDWEFAHFGSPAQDLAHLAAHVFMEGLAQRRRADAETSLNSFAAAWRARVGAAASLLWTEETQRDAGLHFGCEVLARLWGPFSDSGPLARLPLEAAERREASETALEALRSPEFVLPGLSVAVVQKTY